MRSLLGLTSGWVGVYTSSCTVCAQRCSNVLD